MKYKIEEAVIIETYEVEPVYPVELIEVEPVRERRRSRGLFSSFFDDIIDVFFGSDRSEPPTRENYKQEDTEIALIVQTEEIPVDEIHYFYAEIIQE